MKSSPVPWSEFETDDGDFGVKMDDAHSVIFGNLEGSCGICHANARLTSLAPELLEMLENVSKKFHTTGDWQDGHDYTFDLCNHPLCANARNLISKAKLT